MYVYMYECIYEDVYNCPIRFLYKIVYIMFLSHRRNHLRLMRMSICMYIYVITVCMYQTTSTTSARPYKFIYMYICMHELGSANIVKIHSKRQYYCLYNTYIHNIVAES